LNISAAFVTSAASAADFPGDGLSEVALVGRSNVGKSSLINALTRRRVARTSAAPGKTRLANIYSVARGSSRALYLVDLPGYGYARGGAESAQEFADLTLAYFGREEPDGQESRVGKLAPASVAALLLVDCRHPGLDSDRRAWAWLRKTVSGAAVVATKVDKLARGQRIRALRELESVFEDSVLPVSAVTGEGLDELWTLIDKLANSRNPNKRSNSRSRPPRATAPWPSRKVLQPPKGRRPKK
jgi:GTP-binding protein